MIYQMRVYQTVQQNLPRFHETILSLVKTLPIRAATPRWVPRHSEDGAIEVKMLRLLGDACRQYSCRGSGQ